jgi:dipeptidase E
MKLYLSSYGLGDRASDLARMVGGSRRVGVLRNALDFSSDTNRLQQGLAHEFKELAELGLVPEELDLREYFEASAHLERVVARLDALWVVGGNVFVLRRAMSQSGLDAVLARRSSDSAFVYAGYSAGSCVAGSTLRGIDLVDDPNVVPAAYSNASAWDGLGFVPFAIAPHYRSMHPESGLIENVIDYFIYNKIPFIALRDGDAYISDQSATKSFP